jgi:hypothetical protein
MCVSLSFLLSNIFSKEKGIMNVFFILKYVLTYDPPSTLRILALSSGTEIKFLSLLLCALQFRLRIQLKISFSECILRGFFF